MIVNSAYMYMEMPAPTTPIIFRQNEINYRYTGTNFQITSDGYIEMDGPSEITFKNLDLTNYARLELTVNNATGARQNITVNFIDSSGNVSTGDTKSLYSTTQIVRFDIPTEFKNQKMKIKFSTAAVLTLHSATLI